MKKTAQAASREDGFTLTELLTASLMFMVLLGVMAMLLNVIVRTQPRVAERSAQVQTGRAMIERLTRELREGSSLDAATASASHLSFRSFVRVQECGGSGPLPDPATPSIQCQVSYTCTAGSCIRTEAPVDNPGGGASETLVTGLNSREVFSYSPPEAPSHVMVTLEFAAPEGGESVTLIDGATLRNAAG